VSLSVYPIHNHRVSWSYFRRLNCHFRVLTDRYNKLADCSDSHLRLGMRDKKREVLNK